MEKKADGAHNHDPMVDSEPDSDKQSPSAIHSEKLKVLGQMAAGFAHEISNPLSYALLGVEELHENGRNMLPDQYESTVCDVLDGLTRIRTIVEDLGLLAYKDDLSPITETFLVGDVVSSAERLVAKNLDDAGISLTQLMDTPYRVHGKAESIVQVLVNLINNSIDSIVEKWQGRPGGEIRLYGKLQGEKYILEISDNGVGIAQSQIADIFTPFVTTKKYGAGTGLGMAISNSIVQRHGGSILIESKLSEWTIVSFDLNSCQEL